MIKKFFFITGIVVFSLDNSFCMNDDEHKNQLIVSESKDPGHLKHESTIYTIPGGFDSADSSMHASTHDLKFPDRKPKKKSQKKIDLGEPVCLAPGNGIFVRTANVLTGFNYTNHAIKMLSTLTQKPPTGTTPYTHAIDWGIVETVRNASQARQLLKPDSSLAALQNVVHSNEKHTTDLKTMITLSKKYDIEISDDALTNAYKHLAKEDYYDLLYGKLIIQQVQKRLQERKELRSAIYHRKPNSKDTLGDISDDEYDNDSLTNHLLT